MGNFARSVRASFFKQIVRIGHSFKFKIVVAWILEEHSFLFSTLSNESKVRFNNKLNSSSLQSLSQIIKLLRRKARAKMSYGYLISIDRIEMVSASISLAYPMANKLVAVKVIVLPFG